MQYKPTGYHRIMQQLILMNALTSAFEYRNSQFIREVNRVDEYNQKMLIRMEQDND